MTATPDHPIAIDPVESSRSDRDKPGRDKPGRDENTDSGAAGGAANTEIANTEIANTEVNGGRPTESNSPESNSPESNSPESNAPEPNSAEPNSAESNSAEPVVAESMFSGDVAHDPDSVTDTVPADERAPLHWKRLALHTIPIYLAGRAAVAAGAAVVAAELRVDGNLAAEKGLPNQDPHGVAIGSNAIRPMINVFTSWDGKWYMDVVRLGYPKSVPSGVTYFIDEARAAFFPLFPALGRLFDRILPGGDTAAVLFMNLLLGFAAVLLTGLLTERMYGQAVALRTTTLMAIFPGSFVFSFAYSEPLMLTLAALCLWALYERRWWSAGIFGALTTATRPNGVAVFVAAMVVFVMEMRRSRPDRDLRSAIPVLLSPLGFVGFQIYLWAHTGEPGVWFRVQREAWDEGASFGWTAVRNTFEAFANPLTSPTDTITALSVVATVVLVYFAWKVRLNPMLSAYSATVLVLMLAPATVTARPRFLFTAFPLLIAGAIWLEQRKDQPHADSIWTVTTMLCGAGLVALAGLYGVLGAIP